MSKITSINKYRKVQKEERSNLYLGLITFFIISIYLLFTGFLLLIKPPVSKERVHIHKMEDVIYSEGVLIRDEFIKLSPKNGEVTHLFRENEKVKLGDNVIQISNKTLNSIKEDKIEEIDKNILKAQAKRKDIFKYSDEVAALNKDVNQKFKLFYTKNFYLDDFSNITNLQKELDDYFKMKKILFSSDISDSTNSLIKDKSFLTNQIASNTTYVTADKGGIVSYNLDGYEEILTPEKITELDIKDISKYKNKNLDRNYDNAVYNEPVFKIVDNFNWYLATVVDTADSYNYNEGDFKTLRVYGIESDEISGEIYYMKRYKSKTLLVFKFTSHLKNILNYRRVQIEILENSYEGYKLPKKAIVEKTFLKIPNEAISTSKKKKIVIKTDDEFTTPVPIDIVFSDNEFSYVSNDFTQLNLNDSVIIKDSHSNKIISLTMLERVKGIYTVNTNNARFKMIDVIIDKEDYVLARMNVKGSINLYDKFIVDAGNVNDGDIIE